MMNTIYITAITALVICLVLYFFRKRRKVRDNRNKTRASLVFNDDPINNRIEFFFRK